jgi:hypothetical protein
LLLLGPILWFGVLIGIDLLIGFACGTAPRCL